MSAKDNYNMTPDECDRFLELVNYLSGLVQLTLPDELTGPLEFKMSTEQFRALISPAYKNASEIYCALLDRAGNESDQPEEGGAA